MKALSPEEKVQRLTERDPLLNPYESVRWRRLHHTEAMRRRMTDWGAEARYALHREGAEGVWEIQLPETMLAQGDPFGTVSVASS
ncbi:MAG: hypothetical protein WCF10_11185 [Polyangiales bacterium]